MLTRENIPTHNDYQKARKIVYDYENEQERLEKIKLENFRIDLHNLFTNNDKLIIKEFDLQKGYGKWDIIPTNPCLEESYDGQLNKEIEILCNKHNIKASIVYWCYHK